MLDPKVHKVYIVSSNEDYGGGSELVKVFYTEEEATRYLRCLILGVIVSCDIVSPWTDIFIVVFNMEFGGENYIKCFTTAEKALYYGFEKSGELGCEYNIIQSNVLTTM